MLHTWKLRNETNNVGATIDLDHKYFSITKCFSNWHEVQNRNRDVSKTSKRCLKDIFARESKIHLKAVFNIYYVPILDFVLSEPLIIRRRHYVIYTNPLF